MIDDIPNRSLCFYQTDMVDRYNIDSMFFILYDQYSAYYVRRLILVTVGQIYKNHSTQALPYSKLTQTLKITICQLKPIFQPLSARVYVKLPECIQRNTLVVEVSSHFRRGPPPPRRAYGPMLAGSSTHSVLRPKDSKGSGPQLVDHPTKNMAMAMAMAITVVISVD